MIEEDVGTVVDGRVYRDPDFASEIERYHERMLGADQEGLQRVEFDPPIRVALAPVEAAVEPNGLSGNGHAVAAANGQVEPETNGDSAPIFVDRTDTAIVGTGTGQLLRAGGDEDEEEEPAS